MITKPMMRVLERAFAAEINRAVQPLQLGKSKAVQACVEAGLLEAVEVTLPGRFPVIVRGHELTHAGRAAYCATCVP
jgi:hypothetical protein